MIQQATWQIAERPAAVFSHCKRYRYELWRQWPHGIRFAMFIGLNPSTADETQDDPTVRRCMNFAKSWGYRGMLMMNLFAYRATDPKKMKAYIRPVGPENDSHLVTAANNASVVVAAWGTHGGFMDRDKQVIALIPNLHYLKRTKTGYPQHPLYLPSTLKPQPFYQPCPSQR